MKDWFVIFLENICHYILMNILFVEEDMDLFDVWWYDVIIEMSYWDIIIDKRVILIRWLLIFELVIDQFMKWEEEEEEEEEQKRWK